MSSFFTKLMATPFRPKRPDRPILKMMQRNHLLFLKSKKSLFYGRFYLEPFHLDYNCTVLDEKVCVLSR